MFSLWIILRSHQQSPILHDEPDKAMITKHVSFWKSFGNYRPPSISIFRYIYEATKCTISSKPKILLFNPVRHALAQYKELQESTAPEVVASGSRQEFFEDCQTKYKDVVAIYRTSASGAVTGKFDAELIQRLSGSVKFICHNGAGYDQIDVDACSARGITVTYTPDPVTDSTTELAVFLLLGALRQLNPALASLRGGNSKKNIAFGHDPQGKTLGILGIGRIGQALARRMKPFGMKVVYHSPGPWKTQVMLSMSRLSSYLVRAMFCPSTYHILRMSSAARDMGGVSQ